MKEKEKKKKVKLIIALAIALVVMIGGTYAWLTLTKQGTKVNVIKAGTFELTLDDEASEGILITGEAAQPIPTSEGVTLEGYNFTVKNTGDLKADYTLYLDDVTSVGDEEITNRMADKYVRYSLNYTENNETALLTTIGSNPNRILYQGTLESGASKTFNLKLWIDQDADNNVLGTTFAGQIRLEAEQARKATTPTYYYAFGTPTTASTTDFATLGKKVFARLGSDDSHGVCINDGGLFCIQPNDYDNSKAALKAHFGESSCADFGSSVGCDSGDVSCSAGSNGGVSCSDDSAGENCVAYAGGSFSCG